jgi:alpha-galactosidase
MALDTSSPRMRLASERPASGNLSTAREATAWPVSGSLLPSGFPDAQDWDAAPALTFCADWQGKNAEPERTTEVRILWSLETLFLRFDCRYRELWVFEDSEPNGRRDGLWDRDVAEAFLQPDDFGSRNYKEFEVSPNGLWVDLQISEEPRRDLKSGLRCAASIDERARLWSAQIAIPMRSLTLNFDPAKPWRANFFRAEGKDANRAYLAWQATHTPQPQFHVPAAFGTLRFQR